MAATARPVGAVAYCLETERGLKPDCLFCYDLALPADFVPRAGDGEVESFELLPVTRVAEIVRDSTAFKPNCNLVVIDFLKTVDYSLTTRALYDYVVRDFFAYLISRKNTNVWVPGTFEAVPLGDSWLSRAETAYARAAKASEYECKELPYSAGEEWQKIFGSDI